MMVYVLFSVLLIGLLLAYTYTTWNFISGWNKVPLAAGIEPVKPTKVSIVVAARNEEQKIGACIEAILQQDYPKEQLEIIVVDDHSGDRTGAIAQSFPLVKLLVLNEGDSLNSYKKKAITEGIGIASGELIITTDADCEMGPKWVSTIVGFYQQTGCKMISAPVAFHHEKSWFEEVQTIEFLYLIGTGAASIGNGTPFSCNGANFAYTKEVFVEVDGFTGIDHLASGDDELFMHKVNRLHPETIGFLKSRDAIVYTEAKPTLRKFLQQRKRWASKSVKYQSKLIVATVIAVWAFNCSLFIGLCTLPFTNMFANTLLFTFGLKFIMDFLIMYKTTSFFGRRTLLKYFLLVQFLYMIYVVFIGIYGNTGKYYWKGRHVN